MACLNRRAALSQLATTLDTVVTELKTVVRTLQPLDITQYSNSQLPLLEIREPAELPNEELTSMRQLAELTTVLRLYIVVWGESPTTTFENLIKAIRDAIGSNFRLEDKSNAAWVVEVSQVEGRMPLYWIELGVKLLYYLDLTGT